MLAQHSASDTHAAAEGPGEGNQPLTIKPFRTHYGLWAVLSLCVYVILGFVDPWAGAATEDGSLWHSVGILVREEHISWASAKLPWILLLGALLILAAMLIGWSLQAVAVIVRAALRRQR